MERGGSPRLGELQAPPIGQGKAPQRVPVEDSPKGIFHTLLIEDGCNGAPLGDGNEHGHSRL